MTDETAGELRKASRGAPGPSPRTRGARPGLRDHGPDLCRRRWPADDLPPVTEHGPEGFRGPPELDDPSRRAALGLHDAARQLALGLLRGLANRRKGVEDGTVLAYAGPNVTDNLAWSVRDALGKADLDLLDEVRKDLSPDSDP